MLTKEEINDSITLALRHEFDTIQNRLRLIEIWKTMQTLDEDKAREMEEDLHIEQII